MLARGWCSRKAWEQRFGLQLALEAVARMAAAGYTTLVVDCEDAVRYRSHPELARSYTAPIQDLATLARQARELGLDVVVRPNFPVLPRRTKRAALTGRRRATTGCQPPAAKSCVE